MEKPHLVVLRRDDFASEQRMVAQNLQLFNNSDLHRQYTLKKFAFKLDWAMMLCAAFFDNTEVILHLLALKLSIYYSLGGLERHGMQWRNYR